MPPPTLRNVRAGRTVCKGRKPHSIRSQVDANVARAFGRIYAAVVTAGRRARGRRAFDLVIAATAVAAGLPLCTRNPNDFGGLSDLPEVVSI